MSGERKSGSKRCREPTVQTELTNRLTAQKVLRPPTLRKNRTTHQRNNQKSKTAPELHMKKITARINCKRAYVSKRCEFKKKFKILAKIDVVKV
jgi:hypothetical protein